MHLMETDMCSVLERLPALAEGTSHPQLVMIGLDFRTAAVSVREKLAISQTELPTVLPEILRNPNVRETLVLSTCNRTELYAVIDGTADGETLLRSLLVRFSEAREEEVRDCLYFHSGEEAARHLFRVAAGLESMVPGEAEIVHQLKRAANAAREAGTACTILQRLSEWALAASKRARTQVRYDECGLSVASVAVAACKRTFTELDELTVLVLGAGETAELALHYLVSKGVRRVLIANRTFERAQQLARLTGGEALPLAEFPQRLHEADLVISCTSSPFPIITAAGLAPCMARREGRRLLIVDLAVPRDVEPEVAQLPGVQLLNIDSLEGSGAEVDRQRREKMAVAGHIVDQEAAKFGKWLATRRVVAVVADLQAQLEAIRASLATELYNELCPMQPDAVEIIDRHTSMLVRQVMCEALQTMQRVAGTGDARDQWELAYRLIEQ